MDKLELIDKSKYIFKEDGNIWSKPKKRIIKNNVGYDGYLQNVLYCVDGKYRVFKIHRVIAYIFCSIPEHLKKFNYEELDVEHINTKKTDNKIENLRWCTRKENMNNDITKKRLVNSKSKKVYQYTKEGELVGIYKSTLEAAKNGFIQTHISNCCIGKRKTHNGYRWSYTPL